VQRWCGAAGGGEVHRGGTVKEGLRCIVEEVVRSIVEEGKST